MLKYSDKAYFTYVTFPFYEVGVAGFIMCMSSNC